MKVFRFDLSYHDLWALLDGVYVYSVLWGFLQCYFGI